MAKHELIHSGGYKVCGMYPLTQLPGIQVSDKLFTLLYVRSGRGMCLVGERLLSLNQGDILFFPSCIPYSFNSVELGGEYNESMGAVLLLFDQLWIKTLSNMFKAYSTTAMTIMELDRVVSFTGPKWLKLSSLLEKLPDCPPQKEAVSVLDIIELLGDMSDMIPVSTSAPAREPGVPEKIERIERYIDCNFLSGIVLEDIASYAGMHRTYFCLFFKKHFGMSLTDYVNRRKIDMACARLADGLVEIAEIARDCGFARVPYFNRVFKGITGMSPGEYRRKTKR